MWPELVGKDEIVRRLANKVNQQEDLIRRAAELLHTVGIENYDRWNEKCGKWMIDAGFETNDPRG